jgi:hypothetical protein
VYRGTIWEASDDLQFAPNGRDVAAQCAQSPGGRIAADPGMQKLWPVESALIMVTVFVPCVVGMLALRMMAARAGIG